MQEVDTSLAAFEHIYDGLGDAQAQVMAVLRELGEASNAEIARALGWGINRVTPRMFELREKRRVIAAGSRQCAVSGRLVMVWKIDGVF